MKGKFMVFEGTTCGGKDTQAEMLVDFLKKTGRLVLLTNEPCENYSTGKFIRWYIDRKSPHEGAYVFNEIKDNTIHELQGMLRHLKNLFDKKKKFLDEEVVKNFMEIIAIVIGKISRDCEIGLTTEELQAMYVVNRYTHIKLFVLPELENGHDVVSARYYLSTLAHIKAFSDISGSFLQKAYLWHIHILDELFIFPDLYIFLDTKPEISFSRLLLSGKTQDQYEMGVEKIKRTHDAYKEAIEFLHEEWKKINEPAHIVVIDANPPIEEVFVSVKKAVMQNIPDLNIAA